MNNKPVLYQFSISHYCEKARWALDFKDIDYQIKNLLPGLHRKPILRFASDTAVPVLSINNAHIQYSDKIIDYLDANIPVNPLTPSDTKLAEEAREWEHYASRIIGEPLRCYFYHYLLQHPPLVIQRWTRGGPWYGKLFYTLTFRKVQQLVRKGYKINEDTAKVSRTTIEKAMGELAEHLRDRKYLTGDQFSRADLSVCALLAPLVRPDSYDTSVQLPAEIEAFCQELQNHAVYSWVRDIYQKYRR
ncbi:MAG: glutathione S-transferase family protein [Gammaproteobacteria bacterium]|nr:glutathione S-transferase family protein [Gammaproteobacteria bacterium]MDH5800432.1 glutathione S-transferase family protein [Gammaproteobacteria bacterium]